MKLGKSQMSSRFTIISITKNINFRKHSWITNKTNGMNWNIDKKIGFNQRKWTLLNEGEKVVEFKWSLTW